MNRCAAARVFGVCMFSLFTAAASAFFISTEEKEIQNKEDVATEQLALILERIELIEVRLQRLCPDEPDQDEKKGQSSEPAS